MDALFRALQVFLLIATVILPLVTEPLTAQTQDPDGFVPVTDDMLQEPSPNDWINWRRTLDGWGYSPLDQITRDNVHRLSLAWTWAMPAGSNQPTPLVYDGVLYLANPGNIIQAFDAATGTLRWEYRRRYIRHELKSPQATFGSNPACPKNTHRLIQPDGDDCPCVYLPSSISNL